jgi:hypothetical protein
MPYYEAIEKIEALMRGESPSLLEVSRYTDDEKKEGAQAVNSLIQFMEEIRRVIIPLSRGELHSLQITRGNFLASPFKELLSRLRHLTWQAEQVARGDYSQRVDFMGDFSKAFNSMIEALDENEKSLKAKIHELQEALARVHQLEGLLPICSYCKKIRVEGGGSEDPRAWLAMEAYFEERTKSQFSHGICPQCMEKYFPES